MHNGISNIRPIAGGLQIVIPSRKNVFRLIYYMLFMGIWGYAISFTIQFIDFEVFFPLIWLAMWTLIGLVYLSNICWGLFGKETLILSGGKLHFKRGVWGFGLNRMLELSEVENLRIDPEYEESLFNRHFRPDYYRTGMIKFDYGSRTYLFGLALDEAEAKKIIGLIEGSREASRAA